MPSTMNGTRMNQFVAPTSFITSISRRRANIATRIVLRMSMHGGEQQEAGRQQEPHADLVERLLDALHHLEGEHHLVDAGLVLERSRRGP